mmetsp:Transcript_10969/g.40570  ORF Transcript_10969/g.40570 Transcript_10969/m.40570 type:complete len:288 (-) Transcript_10969:1183-2046(-)
MVFEFRHILSRRSVPFVRFDFYFKRGSELTHRPVPEFGVRLDEKFVGVRVPHPQAGVRVPRSPLSLFRDLGFLHRARATDLELQVRLARSPAFQLQKTHPESPRQRRNGVSPGRGRDKRRVTPLPRTFLVEIPRRRFVARRLPQTRPAGGGHGGRAVRGHGHVRSWPMDESGMSAVLTPNKLSRTKVQEDHRHTRTARRVTRWRRRAHDPVPACTATCMRWSCCSSSGFADPYAPHTRSPFPPRMPRLVSCPTKTARTPTTGPSWLTRAGTGSTTGTWRTRCRSTGP